MLSDAQIDYLQILLRNELLMGVVEKVFNEIIETNKPESSPADSDTLLGQKYRGYEMSKTITLEAFKKLKSYKKPEKMSKTFNKAI